MLRRARITPSTAIAIIALVFAATGGAFAASNSNGGSGRGSASHATMLAAAAKTKTKAKAKAGPRGPAGPAGKNGAPGATGPAGPAGAIGPAGGVGPAGANGTNGTNGEKGAPGTPGKPGEKGEEGSPWTAGGTLPEGSTETGAWVVQGTAKAEGEFKLTAISFPIPLQAEPTLTIFVKAGAATPEGCSGSAEKPGAVSGHLCIFESETLVHKGGLSYSATTNPKGDFDAGTTGGELIFTTGEPKTPGEEVTAEGTWAVTG